MNARLFVFVDAPVCFGVLAASLSFGARFRWLLWPLSAFLILQERADCIAFVVRAHDFCAFGALACQGIEEKQINFVYSACDMGCDTVLMAFQNCSMSAKPRDRYTESSVSRCIQNARSQDPSPSWFSVGSPSPGEANQCKQVIQDTCFKIPFGISSWLSGQSEVIV